MGAWSELKPSGTILDIGTGSGLLALMAAQRSEAIGQDIIALDIDSKAVAAAKSNFADSPWPARLAAHQYNIVAWAQQQAAGSIDTILCNPPYFNSGEQAGCQARATARHTNSLSHQDLLLSIKHLLSDTGVASLILPEYEGRQLIAMADSLSLPCSRVCEIRSTEKKPVNRLLIALSKSGRKTVSEQLVIHQQGRYSADFVALAREFYLKM
nr:methyltransferase [Photobacterium sanctipauli]